MRIWSYHPVTKELVGENVADPNPLESGEWLVPAFSTTVAPGEPRPGHVHVFNGTSWADVPDCRGQTWWVADAELNTESVTIDFIGDPVERELTNVEPPAPPVIEPPIVITARQIRLGLTRLELRAAFEDYVAAADQDMKDTWQYGTDFRKDEEFITGGLAPLDAEMLFELAKTL